MEAFAEYEARAKTEAAKQLRMIVLPIAGGAAVVAGFLGALANAGSQGSGFVHGAIIGFVAGVPAAFVARALMARARAETLARQNYVRDWCKQEGYDYLGDGQGPVNGPYARTGDDNKTTDAIEKRSGGLETLFYNLTFNSEGGSLAVDNPHEYKIMRVRGKRLPVSRLSWGRRDINSIRPVDKLKGAAHGEHFVSLESTEFNDRFDLLVDDDADEVWIRRIFDPATIQGIVDGSLRMPRLRYYDEAWWFVRDDNFGPDDIGELKSWQAEAAAMIDRLVSVEVS